MKKLSLKFAVGLSAVAIGIVIVWASGVFKSFFAQFTRPSLSSTANKTPVTSPPTSQESGRIVLRFKGFTPSKDWIANFEVVNYTAQPIIYIGHPRGWTFGSCRLAARRDEIFKPTGVKIENSGNTTLSHCLYSSAVFLQTMESGESEQFSVFKHDVRHLVYTNETESTTSAQIGFEFFVGNEKRREMIWSESITFPDDEL